MEVLGLEIVKTYKDGDIRLIPLVPTERTKSEVSAITKKIVWTVSTDNGETSKEYRGYAITSMRKILEVDGFPRPTVADLKALLDSADVVGNSKVFDYKGQFVTYREENLTDAEREIIDEVEAEEAEIESDLED